MKHLKKAHVLFLSSWYPSKIGPTNGNFIEHQARAISLKNKVTILYAIGSSRITKTEIEKTNNDDILTVIIYFKKHKLNIINSIRKTKVLFQTLREIDSFDIIHANITYPIGLIAWFISILKKKPFIISEHWSAFLKESNIKFTFFQKIILKFVLKKAQYIIPVSQKLKKEMLAKNLRGNYKVIGNVIDTNLFLPTPKKNKRFTITHISSFEDSSKNISGILNVIKKLSLKKESFLFQIIGDGNTEMLKKKTLALNIPSSFIQIEGTKSPDEISKILQESDLYVSFSNYETFGLVMIESISSGTPVISTNTGILSELKLSECTIFVPKKDEEALCNAILEQMENTMTFDQKKIHNFVKKNFSPEVISKSYSELYQKAILNYHS